MKCRWIGGLALACAGLALGVSAAAATIDGVRISSGPDGTRVVLDVSGPVEHRLFTLDSPNRVVIDLANTQLARGYKTPAARGLVTQVRTGIRDGHDSRVVLDVSRRTKPKSFLLGPDAKYGNRIVIDLPAQPGAVTARRTAAELLSAQRDIVVLVDAGHGGKDPGTIGRRGTREKDIVVSIARKLASELNAMPGFKAVLARSDDRFIQLPQRLEIAHRAQADFFVSIHVDSYKTTAAHGATVYALSQKGATDEAAQRLAERENASDLIGGVSLAGVDDVVATVLLDLSQSAAISASISAGQHVIEELGGVTHVRKSTVQQANFVVLRSPDIPSILVETAYITNPNDEAALRSTEHQANLAHAIRNGIVNYFYDNPPPGTYVANNPERRPAEPVKYAVSSGDTLSGIAQRYRVSVARIKSSNRLRSDRIRVGQVLTIPRG